MDNLRGKVAVITGGGSGIGRAMALTFAGEGMDIAIAEVDMAAADTVAAELRAKGVRVLTAKVDVTDRDQVKAFADRVFSEMGAVHVLCNNAGVAVFKPAWEMTEADWDWVVGVDLNGVLYGVQAFLPRMVKQGQGGHIVNTASIAGMVQLAGIASYQAAKYGVVGLSECLASDLAGQNIGVSVLCPGLVKTGIGRSSRNRPAQFGGASAQPDAVNAAIEQVGWDPMEIARIVLAAVKENKLYIVTHRDEYKPQVEARCARLMEAFDWAESRRKG